MSRNCPTYDQSLTHKGSTSSTWYRFLQALHLGTPPGNETTLQVGGSPFSYTAPSGGFVILNGGTVTAVQFTRSAVTLTGQTSGLFPLSQGDILTVTYTALPNMVFVAQ